MRRADLSIQIASEAVRAILTSAEVPQAEAVAYAAACRLSTRLSSGVHVSSIGDLGPWSNTNPRAPSAPLHRAAVVNTGGGGGGRSTAAGELLGVHRR